MNVSKEADRNFMAELKRTDRARYERLVTAIQRDAYRAARIQSEENQIKLPKAA